MEHPLYHCYRACGDPTVPGPMTMESDPKTGEVPHLHPAGVVISFESEEARDNYVAQQVVTTTLPDGRARHSLTAIIAEQARQFLEACAALSSCLHKSHERTGRVRDAGVRPSPGPRLSQDIPLPSPDGAGVSRETPIFPPEQDNGHLDDPFRSSTQPPGRRCPAVNGHDPGNGADQTWPGGASASEPTLAVFA